MASAEKLPSGRWRPIARDSAGEKIPRLGTYAGKREALHAANEAEVEARRRAPAGRSKIPASIKWGVWWDIVNEEREFESDTEAKEASIVEKHLRPVWGETSLNDIAQSDVQKWMSGWNKKRKLNGHPYSANYIRHVYGIFAMSINKALDQEILTATPLRKIQLPKVKKRVSKRYISDEDESKIANKLNPCNARAVEFGRLTGARPGELAGIHADQVDRKHMKLIIRTVYVPGKDMMRDWPKDGDEREVPLTSRGLELIDEASEGRDLSKPCGKPHFDRDCPGGLIFLSVKGRVMHPENLRKAMALIAEKEDGVPHRSPYDGRRGFATRLREGGAHPFTIMELMGHAKLEESHGYSQQGADMPRSVRAVLGDPAAAALSLVGQDGSRGTTRGTKSSGTVSGDVGSKKRRRAR